jgi:catechol 2,3-dioxygenase-like lactoylglutathione lyase family enzyme
MPKIAAISIYVHDIKQAEDFYSNLLGFKVSDLRSRSPAASVFQGSHHVWDTDRADEADPADRSTHRREAVAQWIGG